MINRIVTEEKNRENIEKVLIDILVLKDIIFSKLAVNYKLSKENQSVITNFINQIIKLYDETTLTLLKNQPSDRILEIDKNVKKFIELIPELILTAKIK